MVASAVLALAGLASAQAVDPLPYDSIATSYSKRLNDNNMQKDADLANLVPNRVRVNQAGYRLQDVEQGFANFYYVASGNAVPFFSVLNDDGSEAKSGLALFSKGVTVKGQINPYASNSATLKNNGVGDWKKGYPMTGTMVSGNLLEGVLPSDLPAGRYQIKVGTDTSVRFIVSPNVYGMVRDATIKYFGINRSGDASSWFHDASHTWDGWLFDSTAKNPDGSYKYKGALAGGWYDCGDHLKETRTQSFALAMLAITAATMSGKDADHYAFNHAYTKKTDGIPDVLREAKWGSEYAIKAWRLAGGDVQLDKSKLYLSVGDFGADHGWWGRPENQDVVTAARRGGKSERTLRADWGSPSLGDWAGGLAMTARLWKPYDKTGWSDTALKVAEAFYELAKSSNRLESSSAYNGESKANDDLAVGAIGLLWATREKKYLNELAYTPGMQNGGGGTCGATQIGTFPDYSFAGGFMGCGSDVMRKSAANTDWASIQNPALYSFFKLILKNADTAANYGISSSEHALLAERTINNLIMNLTGVSSGGPSDLKVTLPKSTNVYNTTISVDPLWYTMQTQQDWVWNRYQMGNLADLYMYWDMTRDLDPSITKLPHISNPDWKRDSVRNILARGMNMILGVNKLDVSWLMGVGTKNPNHPHHRAANPEGRNVPGALYPYRVPVGALYGGIRPTTTDVMDDMFSDYHKTEVCLDGAAVTTLAVTGLADTINDQAPIPTVKVLFTTDTSARIQVDMDKWGSVKIAYGTDSSLSSLTSYANGTDTAVSVSVHVGSLTASTKYWFAVTVTDLSGRSRTQRAWYNAGADSIKYTFTTKTAPAAPPIFSNIKVCNVTSDSADIMWYTANGEYLSSVLYADSANFKIKTLSVDSDMVGNVPVKFHYVRLYGLKERTTYYFKVGVPGSYGAEVGCFRTPIKDVKFTIYTTQYEFGGMPFLGINVLNGEARNYDSLTVRVYMRSTDTLMNPATGKPYMTNMLSTPTGLVNVPVRFPDAMAARYDICQAYDPAGFNKPCDDPIWGLNWSWSTLNRGVQMLKAVKMPETYDAATNTYAWYFDLPLGPTMIQSQSRIRFDVGFARRSEYSKDLSQGQIDVLDWVKTFVPDRPYPKLGEIGWYDALATELWEHPILGVNSTQAWKDTTSEPEYWRPRTFNGTSVTKQSNDWSWIPHWKTAGAPMDFQGIVDTSKDAPDGVLYDEWINPYVTVYRKGVFIYGISPSSIEQATKRTVFAMTTKWNAPFDEVNGNTITIPDGVAPRLTGTIDAYDLLMPGMKGYITDIWVNGVALSEDARKAALTRQADGTWKIDMTLRLATGTSKVDVTIFAGQDSTDVTPSDVCSEGKGCAFSNSSWYVNNLSTRTMSVVDLLDGDGKALRSDSTVSIDESKLMVQVNDPDRDKTADKDVITVVMTVGSKGGWSRVVELRETEVNSGIFRSVPMSVVWDDGSADGDATKVPMNGVDTVVFAYVDPTMVGDSGRVRAFSKVTFPIDSAWIVDSDGDGRADQVSVRFARVLDAAKKEAPDAFRVVFGEADEVRDVSDITTDDNRTFTAKLDDPFPVSATSGSGAGGTGRIHVSRNAKLDTGSFEELLDRVGPNLVQARLRYGADKDTLLIIASEKVRAEVATDLVRLMRGNLKLSGKISGDTIRIVVDTGEILPMVDSVRAGLGLADSLGNVAVAKSPAVLVTGGDRPPRLAWYSDVNGDGTVDRVTLVFAPRQLHKIPTFVFRWPDASGVLKSYEISASASDTGLDTVSYSLQGLDSLVTGLGGSGFTAADLGQMVDPTYGDTSRFAIEDRVAPVLSSAKLRYSADEGGLDTLVLRFSEPVVASSGSVAVQNFAGNLVNYVGYAADPTDPHVIRLFVDSTAKFSRGDSLSAAVVDPAVLADENGNSPATNGRWVRLSYGARPPVYIVEVRNPLQKLDDEQRAQLAKQDASKAVQILVRAPGGEWKVLGEDGQLQDLDAELAEQGTGVMLTVNEGIDGYAYIYDNLGTYLVGMDLSRHKAAWDKGAIPTNASMRTQLWIRWDGRDRKGAIAAYGVYSMRLVSRRQFEGQASETATLLNKIYKVGWGKKK